MKNSEIIKILENKEILNSLKGKYQFTKAVVINLKKIQDELEIIKGYVKPSNEYIEVLKKRQELLSKYSGGKHTKIDGNLKYDIPKEIMEDPESEFNKESAAFADKYASVIEEAREQELKYIEALNSECTIDFMLIPEKDMPDEISIEQLELLVNFLKMT